MSARNGELTYRYKGAAGSVKVVVACTCEIAHGHVTWRDQDGLIVLSTPAASVFDLSCEQADGTATGRIHPPKETP